MGLATRMVGLQSRSGSGNQNDGSVPLKSGLTTRVVDLHLRRVGLAAGMVGLQSRSWSGNQSGGCTYSVHP